MHESAKGDHLEVEDTHAKLTQQTPEKQLFSSVTVEQIPAEHFPPSSVQQTDEQLGPVSFIIVVQTFIIRFLPQSFDFLEQQYEPRQLNVANWPRTI